MNFVGVIHSNLLEALFLLHTVYNGVFGKSIPNFDTKNGNLCLEKGQIMWLENLKELKKQTGMSNKQIAEKTSLPERTVNRVFAGDTDNPYVDTLHRIVTALGGSLDDILADTKVVVVDESVIATQEDVDAASAERDFVAAENAILKDKVAALTAELDLLKMELKHKEEIISLHNYYIKMRCN